jgi:hypothetical protein
MLDVFRLHHGFEETTLPRPPGRGFRDYSMIETHHLKANDFIIEAWEPMDRFPRDGSVVEVEDDEGRVRPPPRRPVPARLGFWPFFDANCASRLSARCQDNAYG